MRRVGNDYLFSSGDLSEHLEGLKATMLREIDRIPENTLLNRPVEDLVAEHVSRYESRTVVLVREDTYTSDEEVRIPIEHLRDAAFRFGEGTTSVPGHQYNFHVPFTGNVRLFQLQGNMWTSNTPRATLTENELIFSYPTERAGADGIRALFDRDVANVEQHVRNSSDMVNHWNNALARDARDAITRRRDRLLAAKNTVASLGFPMKKRDQPVQTYAATTVRKKINTAPAATSARSNAPFRPEPSLSLDQYDEILNTMQSMSLVMERSPNAFKALGEEDIRTHFLVLLNGTFEGAATGETFNLGGKTDILIRVEDRNIFIAECKLWKGPAGFTSTIDQLLGYTSWRDTKTAILVFNRDRAMSTVVGQINGLLEKHPRFKRSIPQSGEARFRAVLSQPSDPDRELMLTVLVFNVPSA